MVFYVFHDYVYCRAFKIYKFNIIQLVNYIHAYLIQLYTAQNLYKFNKEGMFT